MLSTNESFVSWPISPRSVLALNRESCPHLARKRNKPCTSVVGDGGPTTTCGVSSGFERHVPVWQMAQLFATRGKPTVFFVKPDGSSLPSSQTNPKALYPPGPGK